MPKALKLLTVVLAVIVLSAIFTVTPAYAQQGGGEPTITTGPTTYTYDWQFTWPYPSNSTHIVVTVMNESETTAFYQTTFGTTVTGEEAYIYDVKDMTVGDEQGWRDWFWGNLQTWSYTSANLYFEIQNPNAITVNNQFIWIGTDTNPSGWTKVNGAGGATIKWTSSTARWTKSATFGFTVPAHQYRPTTYTNNWTKWYADWQGRGTTPYGGTLYKRLVFTRWVSGDLTAPEPAPDNIPPATSNITISPSITYNDKILPTSDNITVTATASDIDRGESNIKKVEIWVDDETPIEMSAVNAPFDSKEEDVTASLNISGLAPGEHTVYIMGTDTEDNTEEPPANKKFFIDRSVPDITTSPQNGDVFTIADLITIEFSASDLESGIKVDEATGQPMVSAILDNSIAIVSGTKKYGYELGVRVHTLEITATNNVNLVNNVRISFTITVLSARDIALKIENIAKESPPLITEEGVKNLLNILSAIQGKIDGFEYVEAVKQLLAFIKRVKSGAGFTQAGKDEHIPEQLIQEATELIAFLSQLSEPLCQIEIKEAKSKPNAYVTLSTGYSDKEKLEKKLKTYAEDTLKTGGEVALIPSEAIIVTTGGLAGSYAEGWAKTINVGNMPETPWSTEKITSSFSRFPGSYNIFEIHSKTDKDCKREDSLAFLIAARSQSYILDPIQGDEEIEALLEEIAKELLDKVSPVIYPILKAAGITVQNNTAKASSKYILDRLWFAGIDLYSDMPLEVKSSASLVVEDGEIKEEVLDVVECKGIVCSRTNPTGPTQEGEGGSSASTEATHWGTAVTRQDNIWIVTDFVKCECKDNELPSYEWAYRYKAIIKNTDMAENSMNYFLLDNEMRKLHRNVLVERPDSATIEKYLRDTITNWLRVIEDRDRNTIFKDCDVKECSLLE